MANPEQVERLKRSVEEWNLWRREHGEIKPDLSYENLDYVNLTGANLMYANFVGANLSNANLDGTNFCFSNLTEANLSQANFSGAILSHTNFANANLRFADFSKAHFHSGAELGGADLRNARLAGVNLAGAHLAGALLTGALLSHTNLRGSDLKGTDLSRAQLDHAILDGALLMDANLSGTNLDSTSFKQTEFYHTLFAWVDLSKAKELETAKYLGPSGVDINSVTLPHDESTRLHFLRGVGFTETQIDYLPSLLTPRPIEYASLFISYAHQDEAIAKRLYTDLRKKDVPCWMAPHDLQPGNYYRERIDQAIHSQDKLLLLLSKHSVKSGWVRYEVEQALSRENRELREILFPLRLDDAIFDCIANWALSLRSTRHIGDFTGWQDEAFYQQAFTTLLRHLKVGTPPTR